MKITEFYSKKQGRPYASLLQGVDGRGLGLSPYSVRGIHLAGEYSRTTKTDDYSAGDEMVILVDCSASSVTITLPPAATNSSKVYYIKKVDSSGNKVTVEGNTNTELIEEEKSIDLTLQGQYGTFICSGAKVINSYWHVIGGINMKMDELLKSMETLLEQNKKLLKALLSVEAYGKNLSNNEEDY